MHAGIILTEVILNPLTPKSDYYLISPYIITPKHTLRSGELRKLSSTK